MRFFSLLCRPHRLNTKRDTGSLLRFSVLAVLLCVSVNAFGSTIAIGALSFDNLTPGAPGSPGVNAFTIDNFTGPFSLSPDFPVDSSLSLLNTTITLNGSQVVNLGTVAPGSVQPLALQFSDTALFASATLDATLDTPDFTIGGQAYSAISDVVHVDLLPANGPDLVAGTDVAVITIQASPASATAPEPSSLFLFVGPAAFLALSCWMRRRPSLLPAS